MDHTCNKHIKETLEAARKLTILADEGEANSEDNGCILLYSVVRDCAYRIRSEAEREREAHKARGEWENGELAISNCQLPIESRE